MFKNAYKIEQEYLKLPENEKDNFYYKEKMELAGYLDLDTYFKEKQQYIFDNLKPVIKTSSPDTIFADLQISFDLDEDVFFFVSPVKNWVYVGKESYNIAYCEQNNISVLPLSYNGGTIVTTDKDLNLVIALKTPDMMSLYQKKISDILKELGLENEIVGNDILVQGNKICGCAENTVGDYYISYFQISFKVDMDLIKKICQKDIVKIPKGISDFSDITRENLIENLCLQ